MNRGGQGDRDPESVVMGYAEAAEFLNISIRTLERYVREGLIPYIPLPKRGAWSGVRFLRPQLVQWLERRTVKASSHTNRNGAA